MTGLKNSSAAALRLTQFKVANNTALETLYADGLSISEINLVENSAIKRLSLLDDNNLTALYSWPDFSDVTTGISIDHLIEIKPYNNIVETFPIIGTRLLDSKDTNGVVFDVGKDYCKVVSKYQVSSLTWHEAMNYCSQYGNGEWYLPTIEEIFLLLSHKNTLNTKLQQISGSTIEGSSRSSGVRT